MARDLGLSYEVAINLHNLGEFLVRSNDFPRAYGAIRQSVGRRRVRLERLANPEPYVPRLPRRRRGRRRRREALRTGIRYAESNDFTWDAINGRWLLAQLFQRRGAVAIARTELDRLLTLARDAGNRLVVDD